MNWMGLFVGFLTTVLVLDCLFLIFLILLQLPKKETGMGTAFGGATTDALFGAGTGTALTMLTKYATGIFFVLTIIIAITSSYTHKQKGGRLKEVLSKTAASQPVTPPPSSPIVPTPMTPKPQATALSLTNMVIPAASNAAPAGGK